MARSTLLRAIALCWVLLMAELGACAALLVHGVQVARSVEFPEKPAASYDVPLMGYAQYREMLGGGTVRVGSEDVGRWDFNTMELRVLGLSLRAE